MFASDRILALEIGASRLVLAEFTGCRAGAPMLHKYGVASLGREEDGLAFIATGIRDVMREQRIRSAPLVMAVSGQAVFPRYVKLPPVAKDKIGQIIHYEAEQNVPFPIDEVVWDYQILGTEETGEINAMLVAVRTETICKLTDCVQSVGLEPAVVDVTPMAIYNCVRFNYPDLSGCFMVLDIGSRASSLILIEGDRVFSRSIPVAGYAITQAIMKEMDVSFDEAEEIKAQYAYVALSGVTPEDEEEEVAERVSKIVRNVITRLHAEVSRSINFYRSQHGGAKPELALLTGASTSIPHLDIFFREKLGVAVELLNPFVSVPVAPSIDAQRIGEDISRLAPVVGLALRQALTCPMEINLMPPDLCARKTFRRRLPFLIGAGVGVALIMLVWWLFLKESSKWLDREMREEVQRRIDLRNNLLSQRSADDGSNIDTEQRAVTAARERNAQIQALTEQRNRWISIFAALRECLLDGMWLTSVEPIEQDGQIGSIRVTGLGFEDKLNQLASANDEFKRRIEDAPEFAAAHAETFIFVDGNFARKFTFSIDLANPIRVE